jgi:multidrug efflux pump
MFSKIFIERPILATVLSLIIVIAGLVAMKGLPIEQYPAIAPVQVQVSAVYPGADAQTLAEAVAAPIEAQINGVDKMLYMNSTSSSAGRMTLTVYFALGTDPDTAQVQVQNRVALAQPQLPQIVVQNGVTVQKKSSSILMLVALFGTDDTQSVESINRYAQLHLLDAIKRVPGAGEASIMGVPDQAVRVWLDADRMSSLGVTTSDIKQAINQQNALFSAGQIGQEPNARPLQMTFPVVTQSPATKPAQYGEIILKADPADSAIVRLKDVARVEMGLKQYISDTKYNGKQATFVAIYLQSGANGLQVSDQVQAALENLKSGFPPGLDYAIALDTTDFVRISIKEVVQTLFEAIALVVLVVYLFLQNLRATFICTVAIFVALIGTFAGMLAFGFSINLLTLFSLVLVIGLVVDDAIVVVENVERNMQEKHLPPKEASIEAMKEIFGALIAIVLVLSAVFIPAAFLSGTTGQLYKQFAITIVISMVLSGVVAITLTPAMCAVMLRHQPPKTTGFFGKFNALVDGAIARYGQWVRIVLRRVALSLALLVAMIGAIIGLFKIMPTAFVPDEDQGYVLAGVIMPDAASLHRAGQVADRVDAAFAKHPAVQSRAQLTGYSFLDSDFKTNSASFFVALKPFAERKGKEELSADAVIASLRKEVSAIKEGYVIPISPPPIPGMGTSGGFSFWIQDTQSGPPERLQKATQDFLAKAAARPELAGLNSTFRAASQQLKVTVDREKASLLGVSIPDVYDAMQTQFASVTASQFFEFSRVWNVVLQADPAKRADPADIKRLYVRNRTGEMVPLSALVRTDFVTGPDLVPRFNGFPASQVSGGAAPGFSSGQALSAMEAVARETLPAGFTYAWSGLAFEEKQAGGTSVIAFAFGLLIVFLILAAQFESWALPASIVSAVPFGLIGALSFNWLRGLQNDVYFQIGMLVLIGLAAKNAVLIVEFAVELRKSGKSLADAAVDAGMLRLRPIVMTSLAFMLGALPLAIAAGAGANARHSIGTGIIGGMLGATTLALLYVPLFYVLFVQWSQGRPKASTSDQEKS